MTLNMIEDAAGLSEASGTLDDVSAQSNSKVTIRRLSEDPRYQAVAKRYRAIRDRKSALADRVAAARASLSHATMRSTMANVAARADEIVAGHLESPALAQSIGDIRRECETLEAEMEALIKAAAMVQDELRQVTSEITLEVDASLTPAHKKAARDFAKALDAAQAAGAKLYGFHKDMAEAGYQSGLPTFHTPPLRFPVAPLYSLESFTERVRQYAK